MLKLTENIRQNILAFLGRIDRADWIVCDFNTGIKNGSIVRTRGVRFYNNFANHFATCWVVCEQALLSEFFYFVLAEIFSVLAGSLFAGYLLSLIDANPLYVHYFFLLNGFRGFLALNLTVLVSIICIRWQVKLLFLNTACCALYGLNSTITYTLLQFKCLFILTAIGYVVSCSLPKGGR